MRVISILLAAATIILFNSEAHAHAEKVSSDNDVEQTSVNRRYLRVQGGANPLTTLDDFFKLDDLLAAKNLGKSADKKELVAKGKALFERMSTYPTVKTDILKKVSESDDSKWFKSVWRAYLWRKAQKFDAKEIAAARNHRITS